MSGPDYTRHDPKGWCGDIRRGAAMGRHTYAGEPAFAGRLYVRRVRLDSGGYDPNGTYFGSGPGTLPLYWVASEDCEIDRMLRARDRAEAVAQVRALYPAARVRP